MPKFFIDRKDIENDEIVFMGEEFIHMTKSLRMKNDEKFISTDGDFDYVCIVNDISKDRLICKILEKNEAKGEPNIKVYVYIALTKGDKLELVCQKITELGAYKIIPFVSDRCVSKPDAKSSAKKRDRLQKICKEASKQSGRSKIPEVLEFLTAKEVAKLANEHDLSMVFYENEEQLGIKTVLQQEEFNSVAIVIGPEGGFSENEISLFKDNGYRIVSLGDRILRAETAPIACISAIMYETGNL